MSKLFWECLTTWSLPLTPLLGAQAILAHAAGENSPTDPGLVNEYIASLVRTLYYGLKVPIIVQGELRPSLLHIPLHAISPRQAEVAPRYLSTRNIVLWQKEEYDKIGAKRVVVVSYYPHYWRAVKATKKVGLEVVIPVGIREVYDPNNSQWWARSGAINKPYELVARLYFLEKGWI